MTQDSGVVRAKIENTLSKLMRAHEDMLNGKIAHRTFNGALQDTTGELTRMVISGEKERRSSVTVEDFSAAKESFIAP